MKNESKNRIFILSCIVVVFVFISLIGIFFWPTLYRYDKVDQKWPVRIQRFTGATEVLTYQGWIPISKYENTNTLPQDVPVDQLKKISSSLSYRQQMSVLTPTEVLNRAIDGSIYNSTDKTLSDIVVTITIYASVNKTVEDTRSYKLTINKNGSETTLTCPPLSDTSVRYYFDLDLSNKKYDMKITSAKWK